MDDTFGWVAIESNETVGFIFGYEKGSGLFKKVLLKNPFQGIFLAIQSFIVHPIHSWSVLRWFLNPYVASKKAEHPELLYLAVDAYFRKQGIGKKLTDQMADYLRNKNYSGYVLSTAAEDPVSNGFYEKIGGQFLYEYTEGPGLRRNRYFFKI